MADVQSQFIEFHKAIRLRNNDEKAKLQEKRDLLLEDLENGISRREDDHRDLSFDSFNQGSYIMHTGVKPVNDEYDIDIGLIFDNYEDDFEDAVELKKVVEGALASNVRTTAIRRPCVTVTYIKDGEPSYHVDMAIYVKQQNSEIYRLAMGRRNSSPEHIYWADSDPKGLTDKINNQFDGDDRKQFKRAIRFLKRWRDHKFSNANDAPISIALTCAAYYWFGPVKLAGTYNDLRAMRDLIGNIIEQFSFFTGRIKVDLPVTPENDLMEGMTDLQMEGFKGKLEALHTALEDALAESCVKTACKTLRKFFGPEFPLPSDDDEKNSGYVQGSCSPVVPQGTSA